MIEPIRETDLPECVRVIRESFLTVAEEFGFTEENAPRFTAFSVTEERLKQQYFHERRPMFVYRAEGRIAGYYSLSPREGEACELNNLCVLPALRHRRIGEKLLRHSFEIAAAQFCTKIKISIVEENERVKKWYTAFGFRHLGTKKYDFFPFTCGMMEKTL
ncbi:MAG: GNAT family N-acetyltransferase [Bacteroides sp.]|nr:GNAT family N-acetyltransferase [Eubacterium sp.]MCM1417153.1 GNAT family N-acetyltransferase [Roseburia sp.]MCM1461226.1 GNAT family N-acetyltransferase [Bacteroides sp.]